MKAHRQMKVSSLARMHHFEAQVLGSVASDRSLDLAHLSFKMMAPFFFARESENH
jgi:hypothetical protein